MIDFLSLARKRYSVRQYLPQAVEQEKLDFILECARVAPSAVNKQPWLFYVVQREEKKAELNRCYAREWFAQAPLCIVVCADYSEAWVRSSDGKNHADIDAAIAAEHICLAATSVGLGSCWVCNFDVDLCSQILGLPQNVRPVVMIPVGYPSVSDVPDKNRKSIDEIVRIV